MENSRMRILATCQYGWPEPYPSLYPMEEMAKRGHYVHAITGVPNYPMGEIFEGYKNKKTEEEHEGVYITHVPVIPRKHNPITRFLNYHSYPKSAKKELENIGGDYDVVFANQSSPVMMVQPAIKYAKKWNKKVVMYCMDLWPASLAVGGVSKDSMLYKFYYNISKNIYTNVDKILVTSRMFKDYFVEEFKISEDRIDYLPQYAIAEFDSIPEQPKKDTTDFMFAGNVGSAQNLYVVLRAAKITQDSNIDDHGKKIQFHIIGNGQELDKLKDYAKENGISNVIFHGRKPSKDMPKFYSLADAMMVTLTADPFITLTLPAKVQSYMAAGKPILASANGEIANVISESESGFCAKADDEKGFVECIKKFINSNREVLGRNAKDYYESNFSREIVMDKLERILFEHAKK